jgi:hypothetical protein
MSIYQSTWHGGIPEESNLFVYTFETSYGNKCDMAMSHHKTGWDGCGEHSRQLLISDDVIVYNKITNNLNLGIGLLS